MSGRLLELLGAFLAGGVIFFFVGIAVREWRVWARDRKIWAEIEGAESTVAIDPALSDPFANTEAFVAAPAGNVEPIKRKTRTTPKRKPKG